MKGTVRRKAAAAALLRALPFVLLSAAFVTVALYPRGTQSPDADAARVVRIWNIDTFEGGKGSRTAFLKRTASVAEARNGDVLYLISSQTREGAQRALSQGDVPDILSFGPGFSAAAPYCLPLGSAFAGERRAVPWCRGQYVLFSLSENFTQPGPTALSVGGDNLTCAAAALAGVDGTEIQSMTAYLGFLDGTYRYLLGTQRDICRFAARGVSVYTRELPVFRDLYQYVAVLSEHAYDDCMVFLNALLSEEVQRSLDAIGMQPVAGASGYTVGAFADGSQLQAVREAAHGENAGKNIVKFLKTV